MRRPIDYALFESDYWKPEPGNEYTLLVKDWEMIYTDYHGQTEMKPVISMTVVSVNDEVLPKPKQFTTGAQSFALGFRPVDEKAGAEKRSAARIRVVYDKTKQYRVEDKSEVQK